MAVGTGMVQRSALVRLDGSWDRADTKDCIAWCKFTLGLSWCDELDYMKETAVVLCW